VSQHFLGRDDEDDYYLATDDEGSDSGVSDGIGERPTEPAPAAAPLRLDAPSPPPPPPVLRGRRGVRGVTSKPSAPALTAQQLLDAASRRRSALNR
jgi:hypothetical protein